MQHKKIFLWAGVFLLCPTLQLFAQPVRSVPAKTPVTNKTSTPVKPKTVVVEKNKDSDGDGLIDKIDKCPDVYGVPSNNGCPEEKKDALIKIMCDIDSKIYVDGVLNTSVTAGQMANLNLKKGTYQLKVTSAKYPGIFAIKDGYKADPVNGEDYWSVQLKEAHMEYWGNELVRLISTCLLSSFKREKQPDGSYVIVQQSISYSSGSIIMQVKETKYYSDNSSRLQSSYTTTMSIAQLKEVYSSTSPGNPSDIVSWGSSYHGSLIGKCRFVNNLTGEKADREYIITTYKPDCAVRLNQEISELLSGIMRVY